MNEEECINLLNEKDKELAEAREATARAYAEGAEIAAKFEERLRTQKLGHDIDIESLTRLYKTHQKTERVLRKYKSVLERIRDGANAMTTIKIIAIADRALAGAPSWDGPTMTFAMVYYCRLGSHTHLAYIHRNIGANIYWCPEHGLLATSTMKLDGVYEKQMNDAQYDKFVRKAEAGTSEGEERAKHSGSPSSGPDTDDATGKSCHFCKATESQGATFEKGGKVGVGGGKFDLVCDFCHRVMEKSADIPLEPGETRNMGDIAREVVEEDMEAKDNLGLDVLDEVPEAPSCRCGHPQSDHSFRGGPNLCNNCSCDKYRPNTHCDKPDRDNPKMTCGYPLPCPHHTIIMELKKD